MNVLVIGGTRFFGIHMVNKLLENGHQVTIATRGNAVDKFENSVDKIVFDRNNEDSIKKAFSGRKYDIVIDKIAYCSNDVKKLLDVINCKKYIIMSSTAVYEQKHIGTMEDEFNPLNKNLKWCDRWDADYSEVKRQAECAVWQCYPNFTAIAVRYPYVIGKDDYTKRLFFYIEHVVKEIPMFIDNMDVQMGFIDSLDAGEFIAYLCDVAFSGAINGALIGTISIRQILSYVEEQTGKKTILSNDGDIAPYNGETEYSIDVKRAENLGYTFKHIEDYFYPLLDYYIDNIVEKEK